jgi:hypothetical protein
MSDSSREEAIERHYSDNWPGAFVRERWERGPVHELPNAFRVLVFNRTPRTAAYAHVWHVSARRREPARAPPDGRADESRTEARTRRATHCDRSLSSDRKPPRPRAYRELRSAMVARLGLHSRAALLAVSGWPQPGMAREPSHPLSLVGPDHRRRTRVQQALRSRCTRGAFRGRPVRLPRSPSAFGRGKAMNAPFASMISERKQLVAVRVSGEEPAAVGPPRGRSPSTTSRAERVTGHARTPDLTCATAAVASAGLGAR